MTDTMKSNNGLTLKQEDEIDDLLIDLVSIKLRIEDLGRHRSYSLAVTKVDEAALWLKDRKHRAA